MLLLPVVNQRVDCVDESMLGNRVEESSLVAYREMSGWGLGEVAVEVAPELWGGELPGMLGVKVLEYDVESSAGDAEEVATE